MSEIKHTPGPWQFDEGHCSAFPMLCLYAADNMNPFHGTRSDEEQNANARLIAAAPELLEALQQCFDYPDDMFTIPDNEPFTMTVTGRNLKMVHAAIAKATGSSQS